MSTIFNNLFSINGVIDTGNSVLQNMNEIASACGSWITYDINQGKWAVVINQAGSSVVSFNDSNIIGGISISSTSLTEVYNAVEIEFPHKDLRDQKDYVKLSIPLVDRYPNEPDNVLSIKTELINDPLQAELIAARELKQSRIDKVIQIRTDYTTLELAAGDLISVTNTIYGFSSKVFRIIKIDEEDADDGTIIFSITALEYSDSIYSTAGLVRGERNRNSGIASKSVNAAVQASDYAYTSNAVTTALNNDQQLLYYLVAALGNFKMPTYDSIIVGTAAAGINTSYNSWNGASSPEFTGIINSTTTNGLAGQAWVSLAIITYTIDSAQPYSQTSLIFNVNLPEGNIVYSTGTVSGFYSSYVAVYYNTGTVFDSATAVLIDYKRAGLTTSSVPFQFNTPSAGVYSFIIIPARTYDISSGGFYPPISFGSTKTNAQGYAASVSGILLLVY